MQNMEEEELEKYKEDKQKLKEVFRDEEIKHYPIIIKASSAGTLETLLNEADKLIKGVLQSECYRLQCWTYYRR